MKQIYSNAKVYTAAPELCEAFVVENNKFIFAGSNAEAEKLYAPGDERIDLTGAFVCPGFNDSHMHLLSFGQALSTAPLHEHTRSLSDLLACLKGHLEKGSLRGGWLVGRGWNQDYFEDAHRMPNRHDLDKVSTDIPICAVRACGHALSVNSKALEILGISADTPQIEGGRIEMENGEPSGVFFDNAIEIVYAAIPNPDKAELKNMLRAACRALNSYGVTSCQTDDYCLFRTLPWGTVNEAYKELEQSGELTVRVYEQANFTELESLKAFVAAGNNTGLGTEMFKIGPLKMLGDGALGSRTAYLSRPYADAPETCGIPVFTQQTFDEMIGYANSVNMQCAIHSIGDACLDSVLSAFDKALAENPRENHRHGIVHCQITRPEQLKKLADMKMHIYAQSIFLDYDINIVEQRVGAELAGTSYSWKTLKNMGATVSNGTDCPVELPKALSGIECAVSRKTLSGVGPYLPNEAFTVSEALDSYTTAGAYASFEEDVKGRIAPGFYADFVVLKDSPFEAESIKDIEILATYLNGKKVY